MSAESVNSKTFTNETVVYFGTGTATDPSPLNGKGFCGNNPTNSSYFAAVQPELEAEDTGICGACLELWCPTCAAGVAVQVVDECTGCIKSADDGSLAVSATALGVLLGGGASLATEKGVVSDVSWKIVSCPTSWGPIDNSLISASASASSSSSPSSYATTATSSQSSSSSSNVGAIVGGVVAGIVVLTVVAFFLFRHLRRSSQNKPPAAESVALTRPDTGVSEFYSNSPIPQQQRHLPQQNSGFLRSTGAATPVGIASESIASPTVYVSSHGSNPHSVITNQSRREAGPLPSKLDASLFSGFNTSSSTNNETIGMASISTARPEAAALQSKTDPLLIGIHETSLSNASPDIKKHKFNNNAEQIPANPEEWSVDNVAVWVLANGGSEETSLLIKDQEIDGPSLLLLSPDDISTGLKIRTIGQRLKLQNAIEGLKLALNKKQQGFTSSEGVEFPPAYE